MKAKDFVRLYQEWKEKERQIKLVREWFDFTEEPNADAAEGEVRYVQLYKPKPYDDYTARQFYPGDRFFGLVRMVLERYINEESQVISEELRILEDMVSEEDDEEEQEPCQSGIHLTP